MKCFRVVIRPEALEEIKSAYQYIAGDSTFEARKWLVGLYDLIDSLEKMPKRFRVAREAEFLTEDVRQVIYKSHRLLFLVDEKKVEVLHVRHVRMNDLNLNELDC